MNKIPRKKKVGRPLKKSRAEYLRQYRLDNPDKVKQWRLNYCKRQIAQQEEKKEE